MKNKDLAKNIITHLGGEENISEYSHCVTRLRFSLKDNDIVDGNKIENLPGVISVVKGKGQFQVVIGPAVNDVFQEVAKNIKAKNQEEGEEKSIVAKIMEFISGAFSPILPVITAGGMIQVILIIGSSFGLLSETSSFYMITNQLSQAAFYFIPVYLGYTSAKMLGFDPFLGMMLAGALIIPDLTAMIGAEGGIKYFGVTLQPIVYSASVLPILMGVWVMSFVYKFSNKVIPNSLKFVLVPLLTVLVAFPITIIILGPIGFVVGEQLGKVLEFLSINLGWASVMIMGMLSPLLVMGGMHYALFPMLITSLATHGYDMLIVPGMLASNMAQAGAAFAVALKIKNSKQKQIAMSSSITALLGVTEPALYGTNLPLKKPLYAALIGGAAGGFVAGIGSLKSYALISSVAALPSYLTSNKNFIVAILTVVVGFSVAFVITYLSKIEEDTSVESVEIHNIGKGKVIALEDVNDEAFSSLSLGKGYAVVPTEGKITSPVSGTVTVLFPTNHAIGITTKEGVEVLIHIGIDTVKLDGEHFNALIKQGDTVEVGDVLVDVDLNKVTEAGYDITTMVVITNTQDYQDIEVDNNKKIPAVVVL